MAESISLGMEWRQINFWCYTPSQTKAQNLVKKIAQKGGQAEFLPTLKALYQKLQSESLYLVIIGCKPQQFPSLIKDLRSEKILTHPQFQKATALSIMAGVSLSLLKKSWGKVVVRLMPNTPSKIGQGVLLFSCGDKIETELLDLFKPCGLTHYCQDEEELKTLTPFCASGPGLFFKIIELWQKDLEKRGISQNFSSKLLAKTMQGSGQMLFESKESAQALCHQVTSKGGVTFAALQILEENKIETIFNQAFFAALKRNNEIEELITVDLGKEL